MRVTSNMIQNQIIQSLTSNQEDLFRTQKQISTSKEVSTSSDDPTRYDRSARFHTLLARNDQLTTNIDDGLSWLQSTTSSLSSMDTIIQRVNEEGLKGRNDFSPDVRSKVASSIESLLEELVALGNTGYAGRFVFGGTLTEGAKPFTFDGVAVTYNGNSAKITRKIGEDAYTTINTVGSDFSAAFDAVLELRDALNADDNAAIDTALANLDTERSNLLNVTTLAGSVQRRLELTRDNLQVANINLRSYISQAEDVDLAEAILRFNAQELGFRAALESTARFQTLTILDHLR